MKVLRKENLKTSGFTFEPLLCGSFVRGKGVLSMTQNQIAYWNLKEQQRANRAQESLKDYSNRETKRSNMRQEELKDYIQQHQAKRMAFQNAHDVVDALVSVNDSFVNKPADRKARSRDSLVKTLGGIIK